jgi:hypothetical protein
MRFGTGLLLTGTSWDFDDVATIDASNTYKWDIVRKVGPGIFEINGQITVGNGATTTTPASSNEELFFKDVSTAGEAGGPQGKVASGFYALIFQGSGLSGTFNAFSAKASSNYPFILDADDTNLGTDAIVWDGGQLIECSSASLYSGSSFQNISFVSCGQVNPGAAEMRNCSFVNTSSSAAALLWNGSIDVEDCAFLNNTTGAGIEHDTWNGTDSGTCTNSGSETTTMYDSGGGLSSVLVNDIVYNEDDDSWGRVTAVDSDTQVTHTALAGGTNNYWTNGDAYSFATPYSYTNLTFSGNTYDLDNTTSPANVVAISKAGTSNPASYPSGDFVAIQGSVSITITVKDVGGTEIQNAQTGVFATDDGTQILNADTNVSGVASTTYAGATPREVKVWIRKASSGATKYKNYSSIQNITSSGLPLSVTLVEDPNNNATT